MAIYKVLQDIEAEDTLVGPLTLRQCIYAAVAVVALYLCFIVITKHAAFLVFFLLPFVGFGVFFAFPWSKQQPTEVWALAKVRFYFKPRKRIWNQSGVKQLVTITVPKVVLRNLTKDLSPYEVKSRLKALADTIDSRGWAIKNIDMGYYTRPAILPSPAHSDRLLDASALPQDVSDDPTSASEDIFDVQHNPLAQKFDMMMAQAADTHRQQLMNSLAQPVEGQAAAPQQSTNLWHMPPAAPAGQPAFPQAGYVAPSLSLPSPIAAAPQTALSTAQVQPIGGQNPPLSAAPTPQLTNPGSNVTAHINPAILELATNNDLNVATIAREAQARSAEPPDEIVVSLH